MSGDQNGGQATEVDDGFTPEERTAFESMQEGPGAEIEHGGDAGSAGARGDAGAGAGGEADAAAAAAGTDGADEGDDDGEDEEPAPVLDKDGKPDLNAARRRHPRVSAKKLSKAEGERDAARAEAQTLRERQARLDERLQIINEALVQPAQAAAAAAQAEEDQEPDPEADIFAHNKWLGRQLASANKAIDDMRQGRQAENNDATIANNYLEDSRAFAGKEPNFFPAYSFLMASRMAELAIVYTGKEVADLTPEEKDRCMRTIVSEEKAIVAGALKDKRSPAVAVFNLAKARGYRPQVAADPDPAAAAAAAANGAAKPAAAPKVADEIARIKNGQASSMSLSDGGGSPSSPMTAEKLANMSEAEFTRFVETTPPEELARLMGDDGRNG